MTGYETFILYNAIRLHFAQHKPYNYVNRGGKIRVPKRETYAKRSDKWYFEHIGRNSKQYLIQFFVANWIENDILWVGDLDTETAETNYLHWQKRIQSLSYLFKNECSDVKNFMNDRDVEFDKLFKITDGQHPIFFRFLLQHLISVETYIIVDKIINFSSTWKNEIDDQYVYPPIQFRVDRYSDFMNFDASKFKTIMKGVIIDK